MIASSARFGAACRVLTLALALTAGGGTAWAQSYPGPTFQNLNLLGALTLHNLAAHGIVVSEGASPVGVIPGGTSGRFLVDQGANVDPAFEVMSGDGTLAWNGVFTLANVNIDVGTYGDATHVAQVTVDAKGRVTGAASVAITHASGDLPFAGGTMSGDIAMGGHAITGAAIDGSPIGSVTPSTGVFTTLGATSLNLTQNTFPLIEFDASGGAADQKRWKIFSSNGGDLEFTAINDADTESSAWLSVGRAATGYGVSSVGFPSGDVTVSHGFSAGSINSTQIGNVTPQSGVFTTATANIVEALNNSLPASSGQGAYLQWNATQGQGETDLVNVKGGGSGGFQFWNLPVNASSWGAPLVVINSNGTLFPGTDNVASLGGPVNRWSAIYSAGAVQGSQLTSTAATGTPPLVVASTTNVPNLNASSLNGATFASPGTIGSGTPAAGFFTDIVSGHAGGPNYIYAIGNSGGAYPVGYGGGLALGTNFSNGGAEVDLWNQFYAATTSFSWKQRTGTSTHADLMTLTPGGSLTIGGTLTATTGIKNSALTVDGVVTTIGGVLHSEATVPASQLPVATNSTKGIMQPDGSSITCTSSGVCSAAGSSGSTIANNTFLANTSGATGPAIGTTTTSFFDAICSTSVGQFWVRLTGAWGCSSLGYIDPGWYGADYTGAADSSTAIQDAINQAASIGSKVYIHGGTLKATSTINMTVPVPIEAAGMNTSTLNLNGSPGLDINTSGQGNFGWGTVTLRDLTISGTTASADLVDVGTSTGMIRSPRFERILFNPAAGGIGLHLIATTNAQLEGDYFNLVASTGLKIENLFNGDDGDTGINNCTWGGNLSGTDGSIGINWSSSGGIRLKNFKFNGVEFPLNFNIAAGVATSDIIISDGSIENNSHSAIAFSQATANSGTLKNVQINNVQFSPGFGNVTEIFVEGTTTPWVSVLSITNNVFSEFTTTNGATSNGMEIGYTKGLTILGNTFEGTSGVTLNSIVIDPTSSIGTVGLSTKSANSGTVNSVTNNGTSVTLVTPD